MVWVGSPADWPGVTAGRQSPAAAAAELRLLCAVVLYCERRRCEPLNAMRAVLVFGSICVARLSLSLLLCSLTFLFGWGGIVLLFTPGSVFISSLTALAAGSVRDQFACVCVCVCLVSWLV